MEVKNTENVFDLVHQLGSQGFVNYIVSLSNKELNKIIRKYVSGNIPKDREGKNEKVIGYIEYMLNLGWSFNDDLGKVDLMSCYINYKNEVI